MLGREERFAAARAKLEESGANSFLDLKNTILDEQTNLEDFSERARSSGLWKSKRDRLSKIQKLRDEIEALICLPPFQLRPATGCE